MLIYISIIQICLIIQAVLLFACELTPVFSDHPVNVLLRTVLAICLVALSLVLNTLHMNTREEVGSSNDLRE